MVILVITLIIINCSVNCPLVDLTVAKRKVKFLTKYCHSGNSLCSVLSNCAQSVSYLR